MKYTELIQFCIVLNKVPGLIPDITIIQSTRELFLFKTTTTHQKIFTVGSIQPTITKSTDDIGPTEIRMNKIVNNSLLIASGVTINT